MHWLEAVRRLRETRTPGVLVTVADVRGHAPRDAGAKMVVSADRTWGSVGGGNLEAVAIERARAGGLDKLDRPQLLTVNLSEKAPYEHGVQCCGGEVTLLLEPLPVVPSVAIFGVGHVGLELAHLLSRHDLDLHLADSRPEQQHSFPDAVARVVVHEVPVLPELVLAELPPGTHVLVMTHDHAEDLALCDAALRTPGLGSIGLIGSAAKWARFQARLRELGHDEAALSRITTPIGDPSIQGKEPAMIALSIAAGLLSAVGKAWRTGGRR
ncbi:xanthine dehydrogenase accessory protein XdhC [Nocardioides speluncae]|uniref:xanthine dehydrogenase accessory protein XdhC n=1 Tax=Nocardioides speluncae TaxID=2670337 RepID=UPI000D6968BF|nr:xanthine dehydrogenase accessory protein XdhC [Nocardioides speluncae]